MATQKVFKLEAATRQLTIAIALYFQDADPLGVHTLAGAAHGILYHLVVRNGGESSVRPRDKSGQSLVAKMVIKGINFLKHADRDPDDVLVFNPDWTDFLVFDAIRMSLELAGPKALLKENGIFLLWLSVKYPNVPLFDRFADTIGAGYELAELKRIFPALGGIDAKKRTFLSALNSQILIK
jgi:hypothetical protein